METGILKAVMVCCCAIMLAGCSGDDTRKKAEGMLKQAQEQFDNGRYDKALAMIDSLRKNCPEAIEARKAALRMYQEIELKRARLNVEAADKAVSMAERKYEDMKKNVDALKAAGSVTAGDLSSLTRAKLKLDSLRTVFDVECAKIRFIKKKMKE